MTCIGCDANVGDTPAAYAIMHEKDFAALGIAPMIMGNDKFHAAPVCQMCFVKPTMQKRPLKAHFALPRDVERLLMRAGSSTGVEG